MSKPPPLPPILTLAPFSVREAFALGVSPARLRRSDLSAPYRGMRAAGVVDSAMGRARAFAPLLSPSAFFSHSTAAELWGMWLPLRLRGSDLHVSSIFPEREPRMAGVVGHRFRSVRRVMLDGLPISSPVETWRQLSNQLSLDELIAAGDSLVRRKRPLATLDELQGAILHGAGARGNLALRRALALVRENADSARETDLRLLIVRSGLPEPTVNECVSAPGAPTRYGDLVFRQWRTIAEYDGQHHRANPAAYARDVVRLEQIAADDWTLIRVLNEHFSDPASIVRRIATALARNGWRPPRSRLHVLR